MSFFEINSLVLIQTEYDVAPLLAAISFHDAWAYLMHNAAEDTLPDIDGALPRLKRNDDNNNISSAAAADQENAIKVKYGCSTNSSSVATDPLNQMWMQGPPSVFLNNSACPISRSLDAFACAVRTCCDQANTNFEDIAKASGMDIMLATSYASNNHGEAAGGPSPTTMAVLANEHELCSRNIVLSAKALLDQHSGMSNEKIKRYGLAMVAAAMSAFLENGEIEGQQHQSVDGGSSTGSGGGGNEENMGSFTDSQIQNLLTACDIIIQHPLLLHSPGPLYHMASNATILLCHLLNGLHSACNKEKNANNCSGSPAGPSTAEVNLFDEALDTVMAMRKLLNIHRKSLPVKLRCHRIPRPTVSPFKELEPEKPLVELSGTLMCLCRGCQGFLLMGCSPCVAAEQSLKRAKEHESDIISGEQDWAEMPENHGILGWEGGGNNMGGMMINNGFIGGDSSDVHLDDDALLDLLSRLTQN